MNIFTNMKKMSATAPVVIDDEIFDVTGGCTITCAQSCGGSCSISCDCTSGSTCEDKKKKEE